MATQAGTRITPTRKLEGVPPARRTFVVVLFSLLIIIPCLWQSRIQSIDLSSHIYNAWLATLVTQNRAPGLWLARQSNNVLFDWALAWLLPRVGSSRAQKIAVSAAVLVFAWGAILFIGRGRARNWWVLLPVVATFSYGKVFHLGFFNFYVSLGITLWFLAIFMPNAWGIRLLSAPLLVLAWLAHPLPVVWGVGLCAYEVVACHLSLRRQMILLLAGVASIVILHFVLISNFVCYWWPSQVLYVTGANQLLLFPRYVLSYTLLLVVLAFSFRRLVKTVGWSETLSNRYFQFWILTVSAVALIPTVIVFPQYSRPFEFVTMRMSLFAGIALCSVVEPVRLSKLEKGMLLVSVIAFFGLFYRDTLNLNKIEDRVDAVVNTLPSNVRVIGHFDRDGMGLPPLLHVIDRACIGRCFSYANYEASSRQFRLRAEPENGLVLASPTDVVKVESGKYIVQPRDLPLYLVYSCGSNHRDVCSRELAAGDDIGIVSRQP